MVRNRFIKSKGWSFNLGSFSFIWRAEKQPVPALLVLHDQCLALLHTEQDLVRYYFQQSIKHGGIWIDTQPYSRIKTTFDINRNPH